MRAVDTNVLVHAHRQEPQEHPVAEKLLAELLIEHGVSEILTADEDFRRFRKLKVTNPFRS